MARARAQRSRKRSPLSAAARGYDYAHQKLAAILLAAWQPGDPCTDCGKPMWQRWRIRSDGKRVSAIHLAHNEDRTGYRGLQHDTCNLRDGAVRGNRARGTVTADATVTVRHSRQW